MKLIVFLSLILSFNVMAQNHEEDLAGSFLPEVVLNSTILVPKTTVVSDNKGSETIIELQVRLPGGDEKIVELVDYKLECSKGLAIKKLENRFFKVSRSQTYEIHGPVQCSRTNRWYFEGLDPQGQAVAIYELAARAVSKMQAEGVISFWQQKITFNFPGNGDFYSWGTVNITQGFQWDVVGHELGHAIYDQADIGEFGGGQHKIDECYSRELALSEGWASFFSAWLSIDLNDSDAKFEYMVPRRAPITIEHIPSDVCAGPSNEWRVTGFLWDLIDHSNDAENSQLSFAELWSITRNKRFANINELAGAVLRTGYDRQMMMSIWEQNFKQEY